MRVPRKLAIAGFNVCASIFVGLCVYGLLLYSEGGKHPASGIHSSFLFGALTAACIAGICFFGSQWDRRNAEDAAQRKAPRAD